MAQPTAAAPVAEPDRILALDVLRGFALLGILVMNIQSFSMIGAAYMNPTTYGDLTGANLWVWALSHLLTDQKMYGLFSMLFGAGIVVMTTRAESRTAKSGGLHYRRMMWLLLFGVLHAYLLWYGDILFTYAVCGMIVYPLRNRSPRTLAAIAVVFFALGSGIFLLIGWSMQFWPPEAVDGFTRDSWLPDAQMVQQEIAAYRSGWIGQFPQRFEESLAMQTIYLIVGALWKTIGNMLLGMALFKSGVLTAERSRTFYARVAAAGFLIGFPIVAFGIWRNFAEGWSVRYSFFFGSQYNYWGAVVADMGWIGLWMLVCTSRGFTTVKRTLGAVGRTAFSNYILQTLIATTIFYGHGAGLFGSVSRVGQILIVFAIWAVQLALAPMWMRRFEYGPLEWLWRSLTYWRRMPMRARAPLHAARGAAI